MRRSRLSTIMIGLFLATSIGGLSSTSVAHTVDASNAQYFKIGQGGKTMMKEDTDNHLVNKRDNFYWLGQINKASIIINTDEGLLDKKYSGDFAKALQRVINKGNTGGPRPQNVVAFEPYWIEEAGPEVTRIHAGRSSQDMLTTSRMMQMRAALLDLSQAVTRVELTLLTMAEAHRDTIVPAYTNGVAAQPTSYGHYLQAFATGFERDYERIDHMYIHLNQSPMGSMVLNGTGWPLNRERMASYLGFDGIFDNSYDATQLYTLEYPVEAAGVVTPIAIRVGNFIEDLMTQYAQPHPWIILQEGGKNTYVSSAMPQKRNPGILNNTRMDASTIVGEAQGAILRTHNTTPGLIDSRSPLTVDMVRNTAKLLHQFDDVLHALRVDPVRAEQELNLDWTASQELADTLMHDYDIPFRVGHHVASDMVTVARVNNYHPTDFPYAEIQRIYAEDIGHAAIPEAPSRFPLSESQFREVLNPRRIVERRATKGGPQPTEVDRMIREGKAKVIKQEQTILKRVAQIESSLERLERDFQVYLK